jgi:tRNA A-37 threonylcarbamoyl transferase component Bud32/Tfp pilus assembly protein PilF
MWMLAPAKRRSCAALALALALVATAIPRALAQAPTPSADSNPAASPPPTAAIAHPSRVPDLPLAAPLIAELTRLTMEAPSEPLRALDRLLAQSPLEASELRWLLAALLLGFIGLRLRGRGDLAVCIEYPSELRGTFHVRIASARAAARQRALRARRLESSADAERMRRSAATATKFEHPLVARETVFRGLPARRHCVIVEGFLQAAESDHIVAKRCEDQIVAVERGCSGRVVFDFHPQESPVDLRLLWDRRALTEARVALLGQAGSARYVRGGALRLSLAQGRHTLLVGSGDRVAQVELSVAGYEVPTLEIDLSERRHLLFTGCPQAVEPYLLGDVIGAARALEREDQSVLAHLLRARMHEARASLDAAADHYEQAGELALAARLRSELGHAAHAGALYEGAGDAASAAAQYRIAGMWREAGINYERARLFDAAAECFRGAGELEREVTALERGGSSGEAVRTALASGERRLAIAVLQRVPSSDSNAADALRQLIELLLDEGDSELAASKLDELIRTQGASAAPLELCDRVARVLETDGDPERAIDVLEDMRRRDANDPELVARLEVLRKRCSQARARNAERAAAAASGARVRAEARYEVFEEIGRGGMGVVFRARDRRLGRVVALKRLPENLRQHPRAVELFLREAQAAAQLNHPNIVTVYDAGEEDGYYIAMELLEGETLQSALRERGRLSPVSVAQVGIPVARGLAYAHARRIVHRDIKTANLFVTRSRQLKIMDFGLAKMLEEVRRATTVIGGTPFYMAPEQSVGENVDHRADLYSLGVTLYELATGSPPFTQGDVPMHHRHTPPQDPRERIPGLPDALAELLLALLAKQPQERPSRADEVAARLLELARAS